MAVINFEQRDEHRPGQGWQLIVIDGDGVAEVTALDGTITDEAGVPCNKLRLREFGRERHLVLVSQHRSGARALEALLLETECDEVDVRPLLGVAEEDDRPTAIYRERARVSLG
jgi:hypothetical protein